MATVPNNGRILFDSTGAEIGVSGNTFKTELVDSDTKGVRGALGTITALKSDTVALTETARGVHINTGGDIVGILVDDTTTQTYTVLSGLNYKYEFKHIYSSGTTATGIILL